MKDAYEVLLQKEADLARVRREIESARIVASMLDELPLNDPFKILQQKEADLARVRHEIESLQIVAPLLSEEPPSDKLIKNSPGATDEKVDSSQRLASTGTDGLFSSVLATPRPRFWTAPATRIVFMTAYRDSDAMQTVLRDQAEAMFLSGALRESFSLPLKPFSGEEDSSALN